LKFTRKPDGADANQDSSEEESKGGEIGLWFIQKRRRRRPLARGTKEGRDFPALYEKKKKSANYDRRLSLKKTEFHEGILRKEEQLITKKPRKSVGEGAPTYSSSSTKKEKDSAFPKKTGRPKRRGHAAAREKGKGAKNAPGSGKRKTPKKKSLYYCN